MYIDHKSLKYIFIQKELNMQQRRWLKLMKDYNLTIHHRHEKANIMDDALSWKMWRVISHFNNQVTEVVKRFGRNADRC